MMVAKCIERIEISLLKNNDMPKTAAIDLLCNLSLKKFQDTKMIYHVQEQYTLP